MRHTLADWLGSSVPGGRFEGNQLLWILLICTFCLSSVHLITLFLTRWGDRRITGKALLFSILAHLVFAVGIITVAPSPGIPQGGGEDVEEHRVTIRSIAGDSDRSGGAENGKSGQIPVWDRLPDDKSVKPPGPKPQPPPAAAARSVARVKEQPAATKPQPPDLAGLAEVASALPTPLRSESMLPKQAAATPEIESAKSPPVPSRAPLSSIAPPRAKMPGAVPTAVVSRQATSPPLTTPTLPDKPTANPGTGAPFDPALPASLVPMPAAPAAVADTSPDRSAKSAARAPVATPVEPAGVASKTAAGNPRGLAPVVSHLGQGEWHASIDRIRSNGLANGGSASSSSSTPPAGAPATGGDYQPLDTRPQNPAPEIGKGKGEPLMVRRSVGVPPTYRLRKLSSRKKNARALGGSDKSERAVEASLRWLAKVQQREGNWSAKAFGAGQVKIDENGVNRDYAGRDADSGVTALAVLAFLGAGYTHEEGQYADNVERAVKWLIGQQQPDGNLGFGAGHFATMYCHGMATYAIAEAYGMQNDPTANTMLREPLVRAVRYILNNQNPDGGWRYLKGQKSDISMFGWQLMALKSAEIAGVAVPAEAKSKMVGFLKERSLGENGGLAGYREELPPTPAMTAEALFCKQMLGIKRDNAASEEAAGYLLARLPKRSAFNEYYWYYGTLAMYQFGGPGWENWNRVLRDLLVSEQQTTGEFTGSWDPVGPWARYGGRIYSTALSALCLEVYYRFLPLYQMGNTAPE